MFKRRSRKRKSRYLQKRRLSYVRIFLVVCAFFISFVGTGSRLLEASTVVVKNVSVKGNLIVKESDIKKVTKEELAGAYMAIFPKKSTFIYPKKKIENKIISSFKRVKEVDISRKGFSSIEIKISERKPYAFWCFEKKYFLDEEISSNRTGDEGEEISKKIEENDIEEEDKDLESKREQIKEECFFIDKNGFIFSQAPSFSGDVYLKYFTKPSKEDRVKKIGDTVLDLEVFKKVEKFLSLLREERFKPASVYEKEEGDFSVFLSNGTEVLFSIKQDLDKSFLNLKSALLSKPLLENGIEGIEYIDVRFQDKVFYKLKIQA